MQARKVVGAGGRRGTDLSRFAHPEYRVTLEWAAVSMMGAEQVLLPATQFSTSFEDRIPRTRVVRNEEGSVA
jgi:hypothetical protein